LNIPCGEGERGGKGFAAVQQLVERDRLFSSIKKLAPKVECKEAGLAGDHLPRLICRVLGGRLQIQQLEEERDQLQLRLDRVGKQLTTSTDQNASLKKENEELRRQLAGDSEVKMMCLSWQEPGGGFSSSIGNCWDTMGGLRSLSFKLPSIHGSSPPLI